MDKLAQKRGLWNKIKENTDLAGRLSEKYFDKALGEVMNKLRTEVDDPIRSIVAGKEMGEPVFPAGVSIGDRGLKSVVRSAKSNINRREYMLAIDDLGYFRDHMRDVSKILESFRIDPVHHNQAIVPEDSGVVDRIESRMQAEAGFIDDSIDAYKNFQSGVKDVGHNLVSDRGRALRSWQKSYPKTAKKLTNALNRLIRSAELFLNNTVIPELYKMSGFRAARKPEDYILAGAKIVSGFAKFNAEFKEINDKEIKPYISIIKSFGPAAPKVEAPVESTVSVDPLIPAKPVQQTKPDKPLSERVKDTLNQTVPTVFEVANHVSTTSQPVSKPESKPVESEVNLPEDVRQELTGPNTELKSTNPEPNKAQILRERLQRRPSPKENKPEIALPASESTKQKEKAKQEPPKEDEQVDNWGLPELPAADKKKTEPTAVETPSNDNGIGNNNGNWRGKMSANLIDSLQSLSNESPQILAMYIYKYAKMIEKTDKQMADKLFDIVSSIEV